MPRSATVDNQNTNKQKKKQQTNGTYWRMKGEVAQSSQIIAKLKEQISAFGFLGANILSEEEEEFLSRLKLSVGQEPKTPNTNKRKRKQNPEELDAKEALRAEKNKESAKRSREGQKKEIARLKLELRALKNETDDDKLQFAEAKKENQTLLDEYIATLKLAAWTSEELTRLPPDISPKLLHHKEVSDLASQIKAAQKSELNLVGLFGSYNSNHSNSFDLQPDDFNFDLKNSSP